MSRPANEMVQMFTLPSEYERAAAEARRRRRMAELLASQEYDPSTVRNAPIPAAAPLVQGLQAFLKARAGRKADEALEKAEAADVAEFENLYKSIRPQERAAIGPDAFADPMEMASKYTAPRMETYTPSEEERRTLLERTAFGKGSPSAKKYATALLAEMDKKPKEEEFYAPTETEQGLVQFGKRGGKKETGYKKPPEVKAPATHGNLQWNAETKSWEQIPGYKPPPGVTVDLGKKGNEQWQGAIIDEIVKARPKATAANNIIQAVDRMDELTSAGTYTGTLAPGAIGASQFLNSFGLNVDPNTLSNSRAFEAAVNDLVLTVQSALGGARGFTREETAILINAFPKIVDEPQSRKIIGDLIRKKQRDVISEYNSLINDYEEAFPETRSPYKRLETEDERYQRWKNSQNAAGVPR